VNTAAENPAFWAFAQENPQKLAIAAPDGRHWSRGELLDLCNQISHGVRQLGLQPGDRIAAMLPNSAELIAANLAALQIGCSLIPLDPKLDAQQVAKVLTQSGAWAFFAHNTVADVAARAVELAEFPATAVFSIGDGSVLRNITTLLSDQPCTAPQDRRAGATVFYCPDSTQAFTPHTRTSISASPEKMVADSCQLLHLLDIEPQAHNVHYCGRGLHLKEVMQWAMNSLHFGHVVVLAQHWDALSMLKAIHRYRVTTSLMTLQHFEALLLLPQDVRSQYQVSSTRRMVNHGAPCPDATKQAMIAWWGESIYELLSREAHVADRATDLSGHSMENDLDYTAVSLQHPPQSLPPGCGPGRETGFKSH